MTPAPIAPALTPNAARPLSMLLPLPQFAPTQGVTYPSARAGVGAATSATAAVRMRALSAPRIASLLLVLPRDSRPANRRKGVQAMCPDEPRPLEGSAVKRYRLCDCA